jgi:uncharacterized protein (DUF2062 family)
MLFRRRAAAGWVERLRVWAWPRVSWRRSTRYFLMRVLRLSGTPYAIAAGCAAGVFVSFTPFIGFHVLLTIALAWAIGGNVLAGLIASVVGNPLTFPFIWAGTYEVGQFLLSGRHSDAPTGLHHQVLARSFHDIWPLIKPMMVGALPVGLIAGSIVFVLVHRMVVAYQTSRRLRLQDRARTRTGERGGAAEAVGGRG